MQKESILSLLIIFLISFGAYNYVSNGVSQNIRSQSSNNRFNNWKIQYAKSFQSLEEEIFRRKVFEENIKLIDNINQQQNKYTLKSNQFAHLTDDEFTQIFLSQKQTEQQEAIQLNQVEFQQKLNNNIPLNFTWKGKGVLNPSQDMGYCDASYAFSTIGMLEATYVISNKQNLAKFSEQQLISCNKFGAGCEGGSVQKSIQFYFGDDGNKPVLGSDYPYQSQNGYIPKCDLDKQEVQDLIINWVQTYNPPAGSGPEQLKQAITLSPVSSGIDGHKLRFYHSGIFDDCGDDRNIDMLVTGYGNHYWELKTPFGTQWGENGYLRIAMGDTCGITTQFFNMG